MRYTEYSDNRRRNMREEILRVIEKNSRIETKELAVRLGFTEAEVVEEMQATKVSSVVITQ